MLFHSDRLKWVLDFRYCCIAMLCFGTVTFASTSSAQDDLRKRIDDQNGSDTEAWIYNDINKA